MTKAIYLVMDLVNDIVHADGPNGQQPLGLEVKRRRVLENTAAAIAKARSAGIPIGFVRVGFSESYGECSAVSPLFTAIRSAGILKLGSWGTEVHPAVAPAAGDLDIVKHRVSPFYGTNLEPILRGNGIRRLYLSGVSTNFVVTSAVREGHDRDYEIVVIEDCCSAASAAEHEHAIEAFRPLCHAITRSDEVDFRR